MKSSDEYFFWGSGDSQQWALYSPVAQMILVTDSSPDVLEYVMFLMSSKIGLLLVPLHKSPTWQPNLIDNSCCTRWRLDHEYSDQRGLRFRGIKTKPAYTLDTCPPLVSADDTDPGDLQEFCFLAYHVVRFFRFNHVTMYHKFRDLIKWPFDEFQHLHQQEMICNQSIYLGQDIELCRQQIKISLAAADTIMKKFYAASSDTQ